MSSLDFKGFSSSRSRTMIDLSLGLLSTGLSCSLCALSFLTTCGLRCHVDFKTAVEAEGTQCWSHSYFPYETSLPTTVPPLRAPLFPRGLDGEENKAKMWWRTEMKRPVVTRKGRREDSIWGDKDKTQLLKGKAWVFVFVTLLCGNASWHPFITVYLGMRIDRRKSQIWIN